MITATTVSFAEIAQRKAFSRALDQHQVDQGYAAAVQKKNSLLKNRTGLLSMKPKPATFRTHLCLTQHHK